MPLDVTGELESYLRPDVGRQDSPRTSNPVSPACFSLSSTLFSRIEEKAAGLEERYFEGKLSFHLHLLTVIFL